MNEKQIEQLKEIIEEFERFNNYFFNKQREILYKYDFIDYDSEIKYLETDEKYDKKLDEVNEIFEEVENKNDKLLIKLNKLLDIKDKNKQVLKLEEEIKIIQLKKNITVNEFEKIYNISKSSQRDLRSKLKNPLPYHQKIENGKIVYVVDEVEKWFSNQYK